MTLQVSVPVTLPSDINLFCRCIGCLLFASGMLLYKLLNLYLVRFSLINASLYTA